MISYLFINVLYAFDPKIWFFFSDRLILGYCLFINQIGFVKIIFFLFQKRSKLHITKDCAFSEVWFRSYTHIKGTTSDGSHLNHLFWSTAYIDYELSQFDNIVFYIRIHYVIFVANGFGRRRCFSVNSFANVFRMNADGQVRNSNSMKLIRFNIVKLFNFGRYREK